MAKKGHTPYPPMEAKALFFTAPRKVEIRSVEVPREAGDVVVATLFSGISSGTEMLAYRGLVDPQIALDESLQSLGGSFDFPFSYGYSCVGVVEDAVAGPPEGSLVFAFHPHQDRFRCKTADAIQIPDIAPRVATLFPSVETALQISLDAGEVAGEHVVVFGLGTVGLLAALMIRRAGARVTGVDPKPWRTRLANGLGIRAASIEQLAAGEAALVVEASGNPDVLAAALPILRHEGTALVASWYGKQLATLPLGAEFHRRRLSIRSTQVSTIPRELAPEWSYERRRAAAGRLMRELPVDRLATHEWPFEEAAAAFAAVDRGEEGLVHAALRFRAAH